MKNNLITSKNNDEFCFRKLENKDAAKLGAFFLGLSLDTKSKFGPHPLTMEFASELCNSIDEQQVARFVIDNGDMIAGYFILDFTFYEEEKIRYLDLDIDLDFKLDPVFALCISDSYHNSGVASSAMPLVIDIAKNTNVRRIILMGGTQERNTLARSFYSKFGFKECGQFYTDHNQLNNIDMMLELNKI